MTIFKFAMSVVFFAGAIIVTSFYPESGSVFFFEVKSPELLAKRDAGIDLPFPEREENGTGKTSMEADGIIIKFTPSEKIQERENPKKNSEGEGTSVTDLKKKKEETLQKNKKFASFHSRPRLKRNLKAEDVKPTIKPKKAAALKKAELKATSPEIKANPEITKTPEANENDKPKETENPVVENSKKKPEEISARPLPENLPKYIKGIYITNHTLFDTDRFSEIRKKAKSSGVNTLVIDVQPKTVSKSLLDSIHKENFYTVARVVNFDGGLKSEFPAQKKLDKLKSTVKSACESGFKEIQFDYIRYSDENHRGLSIKKKYANIARFMEELKSSGKNCDKNLIFGADIFGRIPFVKHDRIGQNMENFSMSVDVLYPMLYPSHFYGERKKINNPYQTVFDGVVNSFKRSKKNTRIIPYIQGFSMAIKGSKLSLKDYIKAQMKAAKESKSHGFVVWNAKNDYKETFRAMQQAN